MLRSNNWFGIAKEYKNNNITLQIPKDEIDDFKKDDVLYISETLSGIDCYFIGETYCLSNYETGHTVYNSYSDKVYIFQWRYLELLKQGKTVKLYAHDPDETDREIIKNWMEGN